MNESFEDGRHDGLETEEQTEKIRSLNDSLRQTFTGGQIMITQGVQSLPQQIAKEELVAIQQFNDFSSDNDPYGTHDFGEVIIEGSRVWFKVDCYDLSLQYASEDPADPNVTSRVMTIFLPEEY